MVEEFHRRGHHVQKAHGHRTTQLASDGSHLSGAMIALMPTAADAKRLALKGGEKPEDLHVTLFYLGQGDDFSPESRAVIIEHVREVLTWASPGAPLEANVFGVAHWNGKSEDPSWVWSVGDDKPPEGEPPGPGLRDMQLIALEALAMSEVGGLPVQHSPWVPHICAAYTDDLTLVRELEKRLGPVTFDRICITFGQEATDIPLGAGALTASALRREPHEHEVFTDFAEHNRQWEGAVASASTRLAAVVSDWRIQIRDQITSGMDTPEELAALTVDSAPAVDILSEAMHSLAQRAGDALVREALFQGVRIPEWSLPDDTVTAAVGGRRLLGSVARMTADLLATNLVQSAKRLTLGLLTREQDPATLAREVDRTLQEGQDATLKGPVGTAMSTAQTAGREAVLRAAPPGQYYASEILDKNTCGPCRAVDGEQFGDLEIAVKAYPVMGYKDCVGPRYGHACRGFIVARWTPEETEPVTAAGDVLPFHGSIGAPGYRKLHPGEGKQRAGKTRHSNGGMLGSSRFTEAEHSERLRQYIRDSQDFNDLLRSGALPGGSSKEDVQHRISVLNDLISIQDPLPEEKTFWRGTKTALPPMSIGDEFHDRGFTSVSDSKWVAETVFSGRGGGIVSIKAPKGTQALRVANVGKSDMEEESILSPGTKYRVIGVIPAEPPRPTGYELEIVHD
jgi:hypothetical protein